MNTMPIPFSLEGLAEHIRQGMNKVDKLTQLLDKPGMLIYDSNSLPYSIKELRYSIYMMIVWVTIGIKKGTINNKDVSRQENNRRVFQVLLQRSYLTCPVALEDKKIVEKINSSHICRWLLVRIPKSRENRCLWKYRKLANDAREFQLQRYLKMGVYGLIG